MTKRLWMQSVLAALALTAVVAVQAEDAAANKDLKISGDAAKGAEIYKLYCVLCHGATGAGDGVGAAALNPKPRALNNKAEMALISDWEVFTAIKSGGVAVGKSPMMVAWGAILGDDQKVHDVAAYVRTLAVP